MGLGTRVLELERQLAARDTCIAERDARIAELEGVVAQLRQEVQELRGGPKENSSNSHKPPASDSPAEKDQRNAARTRRRKDKPPRKRGGQKGHRGHHRQLVPAAQVSAVVPHYPECCACCGKDLPRRADPNPVRHQVTELPPIKPEVVEHQLHGVTCDSCQHVTRAELPADVPKGAFGWRLMGVMAMLTGVYKLSRRLAVEALRDVLGVTVSVGGLSRVEARVNQAVEPPTDEAFDYALERPVKHVDATTWRESGKTIQLWTVATTLVTVFKTTVDGTMDSLKRLLRKVTGILVSDRAGQFGFWHMKNRQVCWAHLLRKFVLYSQKPNEVAQRLGEQLVEQTTRLFEYWHRIRDGTLAPRTYRTYMRAVRGHIEHLLRLGVASGVKGVAGSCADILVHREALWTFLTHAGVDPTNNFAERELRPIVMWRKTSFGSQSERGTEFATRMATVDRTLRAQKRDVLAFLMQACQASLAGAKAPSLLPCDAQ